ncbi:MAG: glycosyl transferase group 1 [Flavobacteriales bacterium]|nr:glycosyl transferase group 1 [Flavobacteriales bacterium]
MKKIIISVTNDLITDQRVHKVATSLINKGYFVLLIGKHGDQIKSRSYRTHRFKMIFNKGFMFYLEYNYRLFSFLLFKKFDILLSNDLDTLLSNFLLSRIRNKKLVYDSHELFTEVPELINRPFIKFTWSILERLCLPYIIYSYTVSQSISNYYLRKYGLKMLVVKNFPIYKKTSNYSKDNKVKKIIYQGAVNKDRGIELMIESMLYVDATLIIVGAGDIIKQMKNKVKNFSLENKVKFLGKLPYEDLYEITKTCDLGLSFEENTCLAYSYSLPNKIFDYINAEIPVLISDLPEFKKIIIKNKVGMCLKSREPKEVAKQIEHILSLSQQYWIDEIRLAKKEFCWQNEEKKLLTLF